VTDMKRRPITSFSDLIPNDGKSRTELIWEGVGEPLLTSYTYITALYFIVMGPTHLGVYLLGEEYTLLVSEWLLYGGLIVGVEVFLLAITLTLVGLFNRLTSK
jgi:hypothetical protein